MAAGPGLWSFAVLLESAHARLEATPGQPLEAVAAAALPSPCGWRWPRLDGGRCVVRMACEAGVDRAAAVAGRAATGGFRGGGTDGWTADPCASQEACDAAVACRVGRGVRPRSGWAAALAGPGTDRHSRRQELPASGELLGPWPTPLRAPLAVPAGVKARHRARRGLEPGMEGGAGPSRRAAGGWTGPAHSCARPPQPSAGLGQISGVESGPLGLLSSAADSTAV